MKKMMICMLGMLAIVLGIALAVPASAQENTSVAGNITPYEGWLGPDNLFYGLKTALEKVDEERSPTADAKILKQIEHAEKRIAEAQAMEKKGNAWAVGKAMDKYKEKYDEINETIAKGVNETGLEHALLMVAKHKLVLERLINSSKMPEQAKAALQRALNNSVKAENAIERAAAEAKERAEEKKPEATNATKERKPERVETPETTPEVTPTQGKGEVGENTTEGGAGVGVDPKGVGAGRGR